MLIPVRQILSNITRYNFICKRKGYHTPKSVDLEKITNGDANSIKTVCDDCGSALELKIDKEESEYYWITEL